MRLLLSILVIVVATLPMVSSRALLPLLEDQGTFVRSNGMLKRVARNANSMLKSLETAAQDHDAESKLEYCGKLEELKQALLAIIENLTCPDEPDEPEYTTDSYWSSNDLDLGLIDL